MCVYFKSSRLFSSCIAKRGVQSYIKEIPPAPGGENGKKKRENENSKIYAKCAQKVNILRTIGG